MTDAVWEIGCKHKVVAPGKAEVKVRFRKGRLAFALCIDCDQVESDRPIYVIARALESLSPALRQASDECGARSRQLPRPRVQQLSC